MIKPGESREIKGDQDRTEESVERNEGDQRMEEGGSHNYVWMGVREMSWCVGCDVRLTPRIKFGGEGPGLWWLLECGLAGRVGEAWVRGANDKGMIVDGIVYNV